MALRINADDLGYSAHRDAGIFECARRGAIHSASLMVTGATGEEAARRALEMGLPLGLHLNLTEGTPLTDAAALVDETGRMRYKMDFWSVPRTDAWSKAVYAEACAQLDVFQEWTGAYPTRVDGHQHAHVAPGVAQVLAPLFQKAGVTRTRIPDEDLSEFTWLSEDRVARYERRFVPALVSRLVYGRHGIKAPEQLVGVSLCGCDMTAARVRRVLGAATRAVEWMVHPGFLPSGMVQDAFDADPGRVHECRVLCALSKSGTYYKSDTSSSS